MVPVCIKIQKALWLVDVRCFEFDFGDQNLELIYLRTIILNCDFSVHFSCFFFILITKVRKVLLNSIISSVEDRLVIS